MKTKFMLVATLSITLLFTSCNKSNPRVNEVFMNHSAFVLSTTTVPVGTTVTWTNKEKATHTVTSDLGGPLNSDDINKGQTFSYTFTSAGTYKYHCKYHYGMSGTIIVQ